MSSLCRAITLAALTATLTASALAQDPPASGKETFQKNCVMCHAEDGKGSEMGKMLKVKDLTSDEVQKMSDDDIKKVIKNGNGSMPAFKQFNDAQLDELLKVIRSLKK